MVHHDEPGTFEFCPVCGWQDDLSQLRFPTMGGGANAVSLVDAQQRFLARGGVGPQGRERDQEWRPVDPSKDYIEVSIEGRDYGSTYAWDRTAYYYWRRGLDHVYLPDSWVVAVESDETRVCFTIEAVLEEAHPRFHWPPRTGEVYAYALLSWCIYGEVHWNEGPLEPKASDATGARDCGTIDAWWGEGGTEHVSGEFGDVVIRQARSSYTYLDR
jgi:hypothetical protein